MFRIYPAVDIKGARCVRLYQGDPGRETVFSESPLHMARNWEGQGASYLHVVDLDGAVAGSLVNLESIEDIVNEVGIPVQVGGGVRDEKDVDTLLSMGVDRVVLSTGALTEPGFLERLYGAYGDRILVSMDTREGRIAVKGWTNTVDVSLQEALDRLKSCGAARMIHTDIIRDGTLRGYDTAVLEPLLDKDMGIIAAGGISVIHDLEYLKGLVKRGVEGVIVGRALYSGQLALSDILYLEEE